MGTEMPTGEPGEEPFKRDGDFDPHLARFLGKVVRDYGVSMDVVAAKMNGPGHTSDTFSDPSYQRVADPFKDQINRRDKPAA